ncbi:VOC family protein [Marinobacter salarius]|uniref:VOC family protein n=1 Tax=Marinobacter salarius TaxID=1420917 RepID=UPI0032EBB4AB
MFVVNNLQATQASYTRLGFTVMPRMTHSELGTSNQIIVLQSTYIEFIGDLANARKRIADRLSPRLRFGDGITMMCLGTNSIHDELSRLTCEGINPDKVQSARRTVSLPSGSIDQTDSHFFYTRNPVHPFLSFFFCQHNRPDLIWIQDFQTHPNTAEEITGVVIVSDDLEADRAYFEACLTIYSTSQKQVSDFEFYDWAEFPSIYTSLLTLTDRPAGFTCGVKVRVASIHACRSRLLKNAVTFIDGNDHILVSASVAHGAFILFHE